MSGDRMAAVFLPWWGPPPGWEHQMLAHVSRIKSLVPILVGDAAAWVPSADVPRLRVEMDDFEALASQVSGVRIAKSELGYPRGQSLCELRPLLAEMYPEAIADYPWWGYGDWDVVWGDWDAFFARTDLDGYDIVSTNPSTINGPLTLFRNDPRINGLYRDRLDILSCPLGRHHLDESGLDGIVKTRQRCGEVTCLYLHGLAANDRHDVWSRCFLREGKLYAADSKGRPGHEILKFHFPVTNRWPLEG